MNDPIWVQWLGKKYVIDHDPAVDEGCSCVILSTRVRESLGLPAPSRADLDVLIELGRAGNKHEVLRYIRPHLVRAECAQPGAFSFLFSNGRFCVCTCVDDGVLSVHETKGVRWGNIAYTSRRLCWYHWK